jgi:hypothetical protein
MLRQGLQLPIVSSEHLQTVPPLPKIAGSAAEGMIMPFRFNPARAATEPRVQQWLQRYDAAVAAGNPSGERPIVGYALEPLYYPLVAVLARVMSEAGGRGETPVADAREKVRDGLTRLQNYPGIGGRSAPRRDTRSPGKLCR